MKTITPYLLKFSVTALVFTIAFRYFLSYGITNESLAIIILAAVLYSVSMFASGWYFGKKEGNYLPIYDVGFRFHCATYVVHNLVSELWFLFGFNSDNETPEIVHRVALIWGIGLLFHFILYLKAKKKSINHLDKTELFD